MSSYDEETGARAVKNLKKVAGLEGVDKVLLCLTVNKDKHDTGSNLHVCVTGLLETTCSKPAVE